MQITILWYYEKNADIINCISMTICQQNIFQSAYQLDCWELQPQLS